MTPEGERRDGSPAGSHAGEQDRGGAVHVVPIGINLAVFAALWLLTALTVWVATLELGGWSALHLSLALGIAAAKAVLVVLYFMHVRYDTALTRIVIALGLAWLALLVLVTLSDFAGREREAVARTAVETNIERGR